VHWMSLLFWVVLCFSVAGIGGRWTAPEIGSWYRTLVRPAFAPPDWLFGPVWTLLYLLMAVAAWWAGQMPPSSLRTTGLIIFLVQLGLNLAWSWIFFRRHSIPGALGEIVLLWVAIGATTVVFSLVAPVAAWLMASYWAWVTFAAVLNTAFWRLNR
jgi:translocator protein